jgi:endonuclease/exonuclease/phosphatase family metal-dependent hydrolase
MPVMALDKCFHCENIVVDSARLIRNRATRQASDHLPLLVEFRLNSYGRGDVSEPGS